MVSLSVNTTVLPLTATAVTVLGMLTFFTTNAEGEAVVASKDSLYVIVSWVPAAFTEAD